MSQKAKGENNESNWADLVMGKKANFKKKSEVARYCPSDDRQIEVLGEGPHQNERTKFFLPLVARANGWQEWARSVYRLEW